MLSKSPRMMMEQYALNRARRRYWHLFVSDRVKRRERRYAPWLCPEKVGNNEKNKKIRRSSRKRQKKDGQPPSLQARSNQLQYSGAYYSLQTHKAMHGL